MVGTDGGDGQGGSWLDQHFFRIPGSVREGVARAPQPGRVTLYDGARCVASGSPEAMVAACRLLGVEVPGPYDCRPLAPPYPFVHEVSRCMCTMCRRARHVAAKGARMSRNDRQDLVADWVERAFGSSFDPDERARRVVEEAVELGQAQGLPLYDVRRIVAMVYAREPGHPSQEAGGLGMTLLAYCAAIVVSADRVEELELRRVLGMPLEHFRSRQREKFAKGAGNAPEEPT